MAGFRFLRKNKDGGANFCPVIEPVGVFGAHVYTAVGHGGAEVVVPVGTVEAVTLIKIHGPGNIGQIIAGAGHAGGV